MYRLKINGKFNKKKIEQIELNTKNKREKSLYDLFDSLAQLGYCESYSASRIYYLAYLLSENYQELQFEIRRYEND